MRPHTSGTNQNSCSWGTKNSGHEGMFVGSFAFRCVQMAGQHPHKGSFGAFAHGGEFTSAEANARKCVFFLPPESQRLWGWMQQWAGLGQSARWASTWWFGGSVRRLDLCLTVIMRHTPSVEQWELSVTVLWRSTVKATQSKMWVIQIGNNR